MVHGLKSATDLTLVIYQGSNSLGIRVLQVHMSLFAVFCCVDGKTFESGVFSASREDVMAPLEDNTALDLALTVALLLFHQLYLETALF